MTTQSRRILVAEDDSVNRMDAAGAQRIAERLDQLRDMNAAQLKALYKEERRRGREVGSRGAGLGFIEMAREASRPIDYHIKPLDARSCRRRCCRG
jgi:hypothetical protein